MADAFTVVLIKEMVVGCKSEHDLCLFDDSIKFDSLGNMYHYMDGSTWLETWQGEL